MEHRILESNRTSSAITLHSVSESHELDRPLRDSCEHIRPTALRTRGLSSSQQRFAKRCIFARRPARFCFDLQSIASSFVVMHRMHLHTVTSISVAIRKRIPTQGAHEQHAAVFGRAAYSSFPQAKSRWPRSSRDAVFGALRPRGAILDRQAERSSGRIATSA